MQVSIKRLKEDYEVSKIQKGNPLRDDKHSKYAVISGQDRKMILYGFSGLSKIVMTLYNSEGCVSGVMVGTPMIRTKYLLKVYHGQSRYKVSLPRQSVERELRRRAYLKDRGLLDSSQTGKRRKNPT